MDVFKKQSTQKISNQKMKLKERDKSLLEYVECMYNNVHACKVPVFCLESTPAPASAQARLGISGHVASTSLLYIFFIIHLTGAHHHYFLHVCP